MPRIKTTATRKRSLDSTIGTQNKTKRKSLSFVPLVQAKHLKVSRKILNEYVEQVKEINCFTVNLLQT